MKDLPDLSPVIKRTEGRGLVLFRSNARSRELKKAENCLILWSTIMIVSTKRRWTFPLQRLQEKRRQWETRRGYISSLILLENCIGFPQKVWPEHVKSFIHPSWLQQSQMFHLFFNQEQCIHRIFLVLWERQARRLKYMIETGPSTPKAFEEINAMKETCKEIVKVWI